MKVYLFRRGSLTYEQHSAEKCLTANGVDQRRAERRGRKGVAVQIVRLETLEGTDESVLPCLSWKDAWVA